MGDAGLVVVALAVAVGLIGIVVPVLPGTVLIGLATLVWALATGGTAWVVFAGVAVLLAAGQVAMYLLPGRRMTRAGIPKRTLLAGGVLGVVGFFVVPVLGLPVGFVLGVFLAELVRASPAPATSVVLAPEAAAGGPPGDGAEAPAAQPAPVATSPSRSTTVGSPVVVHGRAGLAWSSTVVALKGVGLSVLLEGAAGTLAAATWVVGALVLRA